jgi:large subunit ribosomal protein L10
MALSKDQKQSVVDEITSLLGTSKMTVIARYQGISVKALQDLRRAAKQNGTKVKVVKNRLVIQSLKQTDKLKSVSTDMLTGMLLYAFNQEDEIAAAQILNNFAQKNPSLEFVGAISQDGNFVSSDEVKDLANLPSKSQLLAGLINTLNSPLRNISSGLTGNLQAILSGLEAKATN